MFSINRGVNKHVLKFDIITVKTTSNFNGFSYTVNLLLELISYVLPNTYYNKKPR